MHKKVRVAIAGVGNCASALIQGTHYYKNNKEDSVGITAYNLGGLEPGDVEFVAAFDVIDSKVGKIFQKQFLQNPIIQSRSLMLTKWMLK